MKKYLSINIPVIELIRRLASCNSVAAGRIFLLTIYLIKLVIVMPVAFLQFLFYNRRINKTIISKPPVFILGHYRSGTTYLQKLMCADPRFGFITSYNIICPNSSLLCGKWLQKMFQFIINTFRIKTSFYNNTIQNLDDPAEEEKFLINKGSAFTDYWRFVFPLQWNKWQSCAQLLKDADYKRRWKKEYLHTLKFINYKNNGKRLVLKSPPNTKRIKYLLEIFPGAKFVYISRNPYHVFYSTLNMWQKAISKFRLQNISDEQVKEIIFYEYAHLIDQYEEDKKLIPAGNIVEIIYEDLETYSLDVLKNIYKELNLPDFKTAEPHILKKLQHERQYQKFEYAYNKDVLEKIERRWREYIKQWNGKKTEILITEYT